MHWKNVVKYITDDLKFFCLDDFNDSDANEEWIKMGSFINSCMRKVFKAKNISHNITQTR